MKQLEFDFRDKYDLKKDLGYVIRSQNLYKRKLELKNQFPLNQGAWASFRFVYNNFPEIRKLNKLLQRHMLAPSLEYAEEYLKSTFPSDPHINRMKNTQKVMIVTYLGMYENLKPALCEDNLENKISFWPYAY